MMTRDNGLLFWAILHVRTTSLSLVLAD